MKLQDGCLDCFFRQLDRLSKANKVPQCEQDQAVAKFNKFLQQIDYYDYSPPDIASLFYQILQEVIGEHDLFANEKLHSTQFAWELYEEFEAILANSKQRFIDTIKIVIAGNIIDYGADKDFSITKAKTHIHKALDMPIDMATVLQLEKSMHQAKSIFYIADNCGEVVFDRFLIKGFEDKITLGVRGKPILNDITRKELEISGLSHLRVVDTADNTPGVSLKNSSDEFLSHLYNSDLIIAKGQGNFETLNQFERPICHLLCIKCDVISKLTNIELGLPHIELRNL